MFWACQHMKFEFKKHTYFKREKLGPTEINNIQYNIAHNQINPCSRSSFYSYTVFKNNCLCKVTT